MYISLNGILTETKKARVSPLNRGMFYGDGCFETLRSYQGTILDWEKHFERLANSLNYLSMQKEFSSDQCLKQALLLIEKNNLKNTDAIIRIQCWREGGRGYSELSGQLNWMIQTGAYETRSEALTLILSKIKAIPEESLSRKYKLSNGLNFIKAAQEASERQADDALLLTGKGFISETTSSNIFWIHDRTVFTASENCDLLPGIIRNRLLHLLDENRIKAETGEFSIDHLLSADAVFCTNSVREIEIVQKVENVRFETNHPLITQIQEAFHHSKMAQLSS